MCPSFGEKPEFEIIDIAQGTDRVADTGTAFAA